MDIRKLPPDSSRTAPASPAGTVREDGRNAGRSDREPDAREDRVEISDAGRSLARDVGSVGADGVPIGTLPPDKLTELRRAIQANAHDSAEVIASIARHMIERGDMQA